MREILAKLEECKGLEEVLAEGFPMRYFSYAEGHVRKLFGQGSQMDKQIIDRKAVEFEDKLLIAIPTV